MPHVLVKIFQKNVCYGLELYQVFFENYINFCFYMLFGCPTVHLGLLSMGQPIFSNFNFSVFDPKVTETLVTDPWSLIPGECLVDFELGTFRFVQNALTHQATLSTWKDKQRNISDVIKVHHRLNFSSCLDSKE